MKRSTLVKRLNNYDCPSKTSTAYQIMQYIIKGKTYLDKSRIMKNYRNGKIYPIYGTGSGRWSNYRDLTNDFKCILNALKLKYTEGNEAPRGGILGNYIRIETKITEG